MIRRGGAGGVHGRNARAASSPAQDAYRRSDPDTQVNRIRFNRHFFGPGGGALAAGTMGIGLAHGPACAGAFGLSSQAGGPA